MSEQEKFDRIDLENGAFETRVTRKYTRRKPYEKQDPRIIKAVIPGSVAEIHAKVGKAVKKGETLMTLEAMKMLNRIPAPMDGTVRAIRIRQDEKVYKGQVLIEIE
ncbi:MAG: acetyl-CoA carboxylase biotin carboxyl carrier protein subunit [Acidobacteria bacterium]|nr:acetyl-CoA carboxylase biotin carboxyl carrier protein subunit [Acidobacteriota bacterium]